jgi:hypothetical protein
MFEKLPEDTELELRNTENLKLFINSRFFFLNEIRGLRPDGIHGLLATTGAGKSTLTRAIFADTTANTKCLLLLSEEAPQIYFTGFKKQNEKINRENISILLEKTIADYSPRMDERFEFLFDRIIASGCQFVFWDNVTASRIFGDSMSISKKGEYFLKLIDFLKENKIGLFYIIHTDKTVSKNQINLISGNSARGSDAIRMATEYFFVMQGWVIRNRLVNFITIEKHREHAVKNRYFLLEYKNNTYEKDKISNLEEITMASRYTAEALRKIKATFQDGEQWI